MKYYNYHIINQSNLLNICNRGNEVFKYPYLTYFDKQQLQLIHKFYTPVMTNSSIDSLPKQIKQYLQQSITKLTNQIMIQYKNNQKQLFSELYDMQAKELSDNTFTYKKQINDINGSVKSQIRKQIDLHGNQQQLSPSSQKMNDYSWDKIAHTAKVPKKYNNYSLEFKKKLIEDIRKDQTNDSKQTLSRIIRSKAKILGIHPKNIHRWFKSGKDLKPRQGGRKAAYPLMQKMLLEYIKENPGLKRRKVIERAKQIMQQLGYAHNKQHQFHYSKGWYQRFKQRNLKDRGSEYSIRSDACKHQTSQQLQQIASAQNVYPQTKPQAKDIHAYTLTATKNQIYKYPVKVEHTFSPVSSKCQHQIQQDYFQVSGLQTIIQQIKPIRLPIIIKNIDDNEAALKKQ